MAGTTAAGDEIAFVSTGGAHTHGTGFGDSVAEIVSRWQQDETAPVSLCDVSEVPNTADPQPSLGPHKQAVGKVATA